MGPLIVQTIKLFKFQNMCHLAYLKMKFNRANFLEGSVSYIVSMQPGGLGLESHLDRLSFIFCSNYRGSIQTTMGPLTEDTSLQRTIFVVPMVSGALWCYAVIS